MSSASCASRRRRADRKSTTSRSRSDGATPTEAVAWCGAAPARTATATATRWVDGHLRRRGWLALGRKDGTAEVIDTATGGDVGGGALDIGGVPVGVQVFDPAPDAKARGWSP